MVVAVTIILIILIICFSVLFGMYMFICAENEINMFADHKYDKRITELEKTVKELKEEK